MKHRKSSVITVGVLLLSAAAVSAADTQDAKPQPASTQGLPLQVPADLRRSHTHLGSWLVADPKAPGHGFHDVYADPGSVDAYRKTGKFPDGAVLVKEIRQIGYGPMTTGQADWATQPAVWFVMVKDAAGRHRDSPLWGDGWLWALYDAKDPKTNVAVSYAKDCRSCHVPAAATDRVFVEGYPTLRH